MLTIIDTPRLDKAVLEDLLNDRCAVVWCRNFISPEEATAITDRLLNRCEVAAFQNIDGSVGRIGQSLYETLGADGQTNQQALATYFAGALSKRGEMRAACSPHEVPIEQFHKAIDRLFGAEVVAYGGHDFFSGVVRIIPAGEEVVPHNDSFSRDVPDLALAHEVDAQFAANIYLRLPEAGGELQLWDLRPSDEELAQLPMSKVGYGNDREFFALPDVHIRPTAGDLVCFRGNIMHGVSRVDAGVRVNMNCFVARKQDGSLVYWS